MNPLNDGGQSGRGMLLMPADQPRASVIGASGVTVVHENDKGGVMGLNPESVLFKNRIIRLFQDFDEFSVAELQAKLWILDQEAPGVPIRLIINSPGGSVIQAMSLYDTIQLLDSPVVAIATGYAASAGSLIFQMCKERYIMPNAMVMVHQLRGGGSQGTFTDQEIGFGLSKHLEENLERMYVAHTGMTLTKVRKLLRNGDRWLTAKEAVELGLADAVLTKTNLGNPAYGFTEPSRIQPAPPKRSGTRRVPTASKVVKGAARSQNGPAASTRRPSQTVAQKKAADSGDVSLGN